MSRLMSVSHTEAQVRDRTKTVTRRLGWWKDARGRRLLVPGDELTLCPKVMGRRRKCLDCQHGGCPVCGGDGFITLPLVRIVTVPVIAVFREPLNMITPSDVVAEGFPDWGPPEFIVFFCNTFKVEPTRDVTRIEWRYPDPKAAGE